MITIRIVEKYHHVLTHWPNSRSDLITLLAREKKRRYEEYRAIDVQVHLACIVFFLMREYLFLARP